ncbi:MAG TPA: amidohydrolase [Candidatus Polarisedimenticolia bacterium]|nr:amidohydrolase [Candidatus Polarisedimenticolia bacterium]
MRRPGTRAAILPVLLPAALAAVSTACLRGRLPEADLILTHGVVHAVAADDRPASAIAVRGGRLLAVGDDATILRHRGSTTPVIDLKGAIVVPGFIDTDVHLLGVGEALVNEATGGSLYLDLGDSESEEDVVQRVRTRARAAAPGEWVLGKGWSQERWTRKDLPDKRLLSDIVQSNPAFLLRADGQTAWVNHKALEAAGINARTPDPPGGRIVRAPRSGEPSGILLGRALEPVFRRLPPLGDDDRAAAVGQALRRFAAYGCTLVQSAASLDRLGLVDLGAKGDAATLLFRALAIAGGLPIRVSLLVPAPSEAAEALVQRGPEAAGEDGRLDVQTIVLFADGGFDSRGAALLAPYADDAGVSGPLWMTREEIASWAARGLRRGLQVAVRAGGDAAVRAAAEGFAAGLALAPGADARFRIEGLALFDPADLPTLARLRTIASVRPALLAIAIQSGGSSAPLEERRLGTERAGRLDAFGTLLEAGVPLAAGSGSSDRPVPPLLGFYAAVTRRGPDGLPAGGWHPEQRLERPEALRLFTLGAAYAAAREKEAGSLEPGKWADFVVLSQDILTVPEDRILKTEVLATYVAGREVYRKERPAGP